MAAAAPVSS